MSAAVKLARLTGVMKSRSMITLLSTLAKMVTRAGIFIIIAPMIGPASQGTLVVASAWSAITALVVAYGFQVKVLRAIPLEPARASAILKSDLLAMAWLSLPGGLVFAATALLIFDPSEWTVFAIVFIATLFSVVIDYISCALRAFDSFATEAKISLFSGALQLALVISTGIATRSLLAIVLALLLSRAIVTAVSAVSVIHHPQVRQALAEPVVPAWQNIRASWAYFLGATLSVTLSQIDVVLLDFLVDDLAIVGVYAAGSRLVQLMLAVPWMATNIMVPAIVRAEGIAARQRQLRLLSLGMLAVALGGAAFLLVGGPLFTILFLGPQFQPLNLLWPSFAAMLLARFYESYFGIIMVAFGRMTEQALTQSFALATLVGLALLLVPALGTNGLILSLATVSLATGLFYSWHLGQENPLTRVRNGLIVLAIAAGLCLATLA